MLNQWCLIIPFKPQNSNYRAWLKINSCSSPNQNQLVVATSELYIIPALTNASMITDQIIIRTWSTMDRTNTQCTKLAKREQLCCKWRTFNTVDGKENTDDKNATEQTIRSRFEVVSYSTVSSKSKSRTIRTLLLLKRKAELVKIVKNRKKYFLRDQCFTGDLSYLDANYFTLRQV